ncbi:hypothetical protein [Streptomyces sp. NPDC102282]
MQKMLAGLLERCDLATGLKAVPTAGRLNQNQFWVSVPVAKLGEDAGAKP